MHQLELFGVAQQMYIAACSVRSLRLFSCTPSKEDIVKDRKSVV